MKNKLWHKIIYISLFILLLFSCRHNPSELEKTDSIRKINVAMVLEKEHFDRIAEWFIDNLDKTSSSFLEKFTLNLEWYDESNQENITVEKAKELANREDLFAIIGPIKSSNLQIYGEACFECKKPLISPYATSESLVRSFALNAASSDKKEPFLWSFTESDVSQTEALLAKVSAYGGKSVAVLSSADLYGKTFFDWSPFIATELGLTLKQNLRYTSENTGQNYESGNQALDLQSAAEILMNCESDFAICAFASYKDVSVLLQEREKAGDKAPKLLFTDSAFTPELIKYNNVEGIEGTAPYADPQSGFAMDYYARFGEYPLYGEAQLFDALLFTAFAAAAAIRDEKTNSNVFTNKEINLIMQKMNNGRLISKPNWTLQGMKEAFKELSNDGVYLEVRGASGIINFDEEILTSVVESTYVHWAVMNGKFVLMDFTSRTGMGNVDSHRVSWEWANLIGDIDDLISNGIVNINYSELKDRWAVIIAASNSWSNYRHQADALYVYQVLKKYGKYDDEHIILIIADDIANYRRNKKTGQIFVSTDGENLYTDDVEIDYKLADISAEDIKRILNGGRIDVERDVNDIHLAKEPTVLNTDENSNILFFWSGHGSNYQGDPKNGFLVWEGKENKESSSSDFTTDLMRETLTLMQENKRYRKLLIITETCYSASVLNACEGIDGVLAFTATNGVESSLADVYSVDLKVWLSNRFTRNFMKYLMEYNSGNFADLYKYIVINTIGSHVCVFNESHFGNLYNTYLNEFFW